jgi:hypothetical protein
VFKALDMFMKALGLTIVKKYDPEIGSFFQKIKVKFNEPKTQEAINESLKRGKRVIELAILDKPQSEGDKDRAEAAASLIKLLKNSEKAVIQVGSLLLLKNSEDILVYTLSRRHLKYLEQNPKIAKSPETIIKWLALK